MSAAQDYRSGPEIFGASVSFKGHSSPQEEDYKTGDTLARLQGSNQQRQVRSVLQATSLAANSSS